jgi:hypothetical protein
MRSYLILLALLLSSFSCGPVRRCLSEVDEPCQSNAECTSGQECRPPSDGRCVSSSCTCTANGVVCTADCGGKVCQPASVASDGGTRDAGSLDAGRCASFVQPCQSDQECAAADACLPPLDRRCVPSVCVCDATTGMSVCSADCNGRICRPRPGADAGINLCEGFEPPCVRDSECGTGRVCAKEEQCIPSICSCEPSTGQLSCTDDCGGGVCRAAADAGPVDSGTPDAGLCADFVPPCRSDTDCGAGMRCGRDTNSCYPSFCGCDSATGSMVCSADCGGRVCMPVVDAGIGDGGTPDGGLCANFVPPCVSDAQCRPGTTCRQPLNACAPSSCGCDPATGNIGCSKDCLGRLCLP